MTKKEYIRNCIGTFVILALTLLFFLNAVDSIPATSIAVDSSFLVIGTVSGYNLIRSNTRDGISLRVIFWFFNFVFFAFTAYLKYVTDGFQYQLSNSSMLIANSLILFHFALFEFASSLQTAMAKRQNRMRGWAKIVRGIKIRQWRLLLAILASFIIAGVAVAKMGFTKSLVFGLRDEFGPIDQIMQFYVRPFTFFSFLFAIIFLRQRPRSRRFAYCLLIAAAIPALLLNFPFSTNRFYVFSMYLALLIIIFPPSVRNRSFYLFLLFAGIAGSYTLASFFHRGTDQSLFDISYLTGLTFDAYESLVYSIDYVGRHGITWGTQLLGGLLFWVPREMWAGKPVGTGGLVIQALHEGSFTNVSSPLLEEAYVNFWLFGVILYSWLMGWAAAYLHNRYRQITRPSQTPVLPKRADFYLVFYPVTIGFFLFALRGDFISSVAYISGIFCSFLTVRLIVVGRGKIGFEREIARLDQRTSELEPRFW